MLNHTHTLFFSFLSFYHGQFSLKADNPFHLLRLCLTSSFQTINHVCVYVLFVMVIEQNSATIDLFICFLGSFISSSSSSSWPDPFLALSPA
jgi:hypothetical protein